MSGKNSTRSKTNQLVKRSSCSRRRKN